MKSGYLIGGMAIVFGIYGLALRYLKPERCPPRWILGSVVAILTGLFVVLADLLGWRD
jgi:drug/metabolite transporter (DMT)-like permease